MISRTQHLLGKLAEELIETAQRALKAQLFGLHENQPGHASNFVRLKQEFNDILGVIHALDGENPGVGFHLADGHFIDPEQITGKAERLQKYEDYAAGLGQLGYRMPPPIMIPAPLLGLKFMIGDECQAEITKESPDGVYIVSDIFTGWCSRAEFNARWGDPQES